MPPWPPPRGVDATRQAATAAAAAKEEEDEEDGEEEARREYLRRHRAQLEQKRRLQTERRVHELVLDASAIRRRQEEVAAASSSSTALGHAQSLPQLPARAPTKAASDAATQVSDTTGVGTYTKFDALTDAQLRAVADKQALREMAPLNTSGKYHTRYIKHAYPIAGAQIRLERERELILGAKKKLLLGKPPAPSGTSAAAPTPSHRDHGSYRQLDFYGDKFIAVLRREELSWREQDEQRRVRLANVQHSRGLEEFWTLLHADALPEVIAWLRTHRFRDINVPVAVVVNGGVPRVYVDKDIGMTPLMAACRRVHVELALALLEQDAAVYLTTAHGDTAAHFLWRDWPTAMPQGSLQDVAAVALRARHAQRILEALVAHKLDIDAPNAFGETPLQHCARLGLEDCVQLLLTHGADASFRDRLGKSALDHATACGHDRIARLLSTFAIIERTRGRERERRETESLLRQPRGSLTASWSRSPRTLLARLAVEERRAEAHLRNQFVDRHGEVMTCPDDDSDDDDDHAADRGRGGGR